ncbi:helicase [Paenibacillus swuensis]|uniref:DNA 3'-5' helicase n=1 Tax=Paenibacillus swuensis TaxID=1178515 RepID=A0A172TK91_9BACL|nr:DNA repair helicase XPB [Paenibacillus swuensis]ANE47458.1 helicase [Paenibacillus swuensis]
MKYRPEQPLIVQGDLTVLLETRNTRADEAAKVLGRFADLVKTPEHIHTYRMTPLSIWNAAASGIHVEEVIRTLEDYSKFDLPAQVRKEIVKYMGRYGMLLLESDGEYLRLRSSNTSALKELAAESSLAALLTWDEDTGTGKVDAENRGLVKQELTRLGFPVTDLVGYHEGESLQVQLKSNLDEGNPNPFYLRDYQEEAVDSFYQEGSVHGGSGVLVLPCGAGKTIIGIAAMARLHCATLILTSNVTSVRQWTQEIVAKTNIKEEQIGEYSGDRKEVRPITIATYQILTHRKDKAASFSHMTLFNERDWGLIIYDEVHLLPAPVFRVTADIQATRRLGLTATLIREDGREEDVFSLVGPKRYDMPWKELEHQGWIAKVYCSEIRVPLSEDTRSQYAVADAKMRFRIACENPLKLDIVRYLLQLHRGRQTLIIGQYLDQLHHVAEQLSLPLITGSMPHQERDELYAQFKKGEIGVLIVSKVANFAVDLPDASVAIQISGSFGSRQEEAQRLGRVLRPKQDENTAFFYTLVSKDTKEQEFALNRQLFLIEKGYRYAITDAAAFTGGEDTHGQFAVQ